MTSSKFVVLTGLDGSGKDFVAENLKNVDPTASLISTPTPPFQPSRLAVDGFALVIPAAHYYFYLASIIHASTLIVESLKHGNVYCGRYLIDTVVYHRAMGLAVNLEYDTPIYHIRKPDLTVFLEISDERIRQERIEKRGKRSIGDTYVDKKQFRNSLIKEYEKLSEHFVIVNNTNRKIQDVVDEIRSLMQD